MLTPRTGMDSVPPRPWMFFRTDAFRVLSGLSVGERASMPGTDVMQVRDRWDTSRAYTDQSIILRHPKYNT